jgi:peroxiredoxin
MLQEGRRGAGFYRKDQRARIVKLSDFRGRRVVFIFIRRRHARLHQTGVQSARRFFGV